MVPNPDVFALTLGLSYNLLAMAEEEDRLTVVVGGANRYFRIGLIVGILAILADFLLELALLRQLSVFNTGLGLWVFISQFLIAAALLLILVVVGSFACMTVHRSSGTRKPWIVYYILLGLAIFGAFTSGLNNGLSLDVKYSTSLGKAGIDYLNLQYLGGAVIWIAFVLTALFMLSDSRISYGVGEDGKKRLFMHSKLLGLLRLFRIANLGDVFPRRRYGDYSKPREPVQWDIGENLDHAVLSKNGKLEWNDRFPVRSPSFLAWTAIKFLLALGIAAVIANDIALRFLTIQNYMTQTNSSWAAQIGNYFGILGMRLAGTYQVSPTFGIDNVFTFEVFRLILSLLGLAFIVLVIRLGISIIPNFLVGITKKALGMSRKALSSLFTIILIPLAYALLSSGTWVYDVGTSFILWNLLIFLVGFAFLAGITRRQRILHFKMTWIKGIIILMIVLAAAIAAPSFATFLRAQSGQYINYQWNPAYVPTIQYTRWAYGVDSVTSAGLSTITSYTNQTNVLNHIRILTNSSARLNMRPLVGVNWMSIDNAPVDIIFINGTEYWVSILQLVQANYANDVDVWRTQHLLLTHSEKILAVNAATTETVDMSTIWKLTQTPQVYYGEGGLWSSVDEVYLNIPGFNETHLTSYKGPASYNGAPDYTYKGFWLYWKFFWQGRFDFANGPEHTQTSILRLFGAVLTDVKTGAVNGYLYNNGKTDYVTSFYRSMYPQWSQPMPSWLIPQLRYPEQYFNTQQDVYNFYFQTDPLQWQRNVFLQSTEDTRFIITPINGNLTWAAVRLVEIYQSPSQNLAGLYIAPAGNQTGTVYLIRFPEGTTVIGPNSAASAVTTDPTVKSRLTLHPDWTSGNMLLYAINGGLIYVIPYYGTSSSLTVPVMVAVVNGYTKQVGSYAITTPNDSTEVQSATSRAVSNLGVSTGTQQTISGNVTSINTYVVNGNTRWVLGIRTNSTTTVQVLAKAETLTAADQVTIATITIGAKIKVLVDTSQTPPTVLSVQ